MSLAASPAQDASSSAASSPLSFQIGGFQFAPGGFADFTTIYRSTNVGSGIGTNFAGIPYNNTVAGRLSELRESVQNSRLSLKITGEDGGNKILGYVETDFLGNQPANVAVSSNSATMRLRLYFVDVTRGSWEILAGQDWSFLTPNRNGLGPLPADIFYTLDADTNYQVGLTWTRQPQFRLIYHASPHLSAGVSLENGEPYIGGSAGAPQVTLPGGPGGPFGGQVNNGSSNFSAPGFTPDVIAKVAYDCSHGLHIELAGLESEFRAFNPATGKTAHQAGAGWGLSANYAVTPSLRLIGSGFTGSGGGRYFFGIAPDLIIRQDGTISPVRSAGAVAGAEWQALTTDLLDVYYGGLNIRPSFDLNGAAPVGYGYAGSSPAVNRTVQEVTAGWTHTFWKSASYGSLQLIGQGSYLTRTPFNAAGGPRNARAGLGYLDLRFTLP